MRILLIEPNVTNQQLWLKRCRAHSEDITVVSSKEGAVQAIQTMRFTLAICDAQLVIHQAGQATTRFPSELKSRCALTLATINASDLEAERLAYLVGFDDSISSSTSDESLAAKFRQAKLIEQLENRLAQAQKLESIGELASGIAHEINTPIQYVGDNTRFVQDACGDLSEILLCCQKLIGQAASGSELETQTLELRELMLSKDVEYLLEEVPAAITQTLEGVDRVTNIVRAMKEFAHPGSSEMTFTDLAHSINNTVMVARNEWKYVAELVTDFDPSLPLVPCLPGELNQVLLNMIVNAAHAIAESRGDSPESKGRITLATRLRPEFAEILIQDTGCGISPENIERVFTPFFTTKGAGKGTGQGLAIAHSVIVEKHGGTIKIESALGVGTTFVIQIPLKPTTKDTPINASAKELLSV